MTASTGVVTRTDSRGSGYKREVWESITVFSLISGDTTGAATIPFNGVLQKIIIKLSDMESAEGTTDVSLTDGGDNTIFSVTDLPQSVTYLYSVSEPFFDEINIILGFTDPAAAATVTVTLRGI